MRIWSKRLIPYLPTKQLKALRYELGDMIKEYPEIKHSLVKFANNYDCIYLYQYFLNTCHELELRDIPMWADYNENISELAISKSKVKGNVVKDDFTFTEDNNRYLKQCYYNLQEKYDRGIITKENFDLIENVVLFYINI